MYILRNNGKVELVESVFKVKHKYQSSSNKVMHSPVKDFITRTLIIKLYWTDWIMFDFNFERIQELSL